MFSLEIPAVVYDAGRGGVFAAQDATGGDYVGHAAEIVVTAGDKGIDVDQAAGTVNELIVADIYGDVIYSDTAVIARTAKEQ